MLHSPVLSIILPVFNGEAFIRRTIRSVLDQELIDWELIVINDGSTDQSERIISEFCALDTRIKKISQENKGLSAARNAGYCRAVGKYIAFLDVDDYVEPNYYSGLVVSTEESGADFVVSGYIRDFIRANGEVSSHTISFEQRSIPCTHTNEQLVTNCAQPYFYNVYIHVWNKLYRHDFLLQHGILFDEAIRYAEDVPYNIECLKHADKIQFLDLAGYHYVCHQAERLTGKWRESLLEDNIRVFRHIVDFEQKYWNLERSTIACGMFLRGCFLTVEKATMYGIRYKELTPLLNRILSNSEVHFCLQTLKQAPGLLEFAIYIYVMQAKQPLLFWMAVLLRRKLKLLLGR